DISEGKCDFVDVDLKGWSTKYIVTAKQKGIINGISETQFAPNENILRQDMAVIVARCAKLLNKTIVENGSVTISDMDEVDEYAKESVEYLVSMGILSGDEVGNFKPKDSLTRAECAKVVYSLIDTDK
ncbi:MAG: S-layer homology domain-containing protein, partial [Oscillospiraceae bacterium]